MMPEKWILKKSVHKRRFCADHVRMLVKYRKALVGMLGSKEITTYQAQKIIKEMVAVEKLLKTDLLTRFEAQAVRRLLLRFSQEQLDKLMYENPRIHSFIKQCLTNDFKED